eukprot:10851906-Lingulodinium_polyedra.AAC.1
MPRSRRHIRHPGDSGQRGLAAASAWAAAAALPWRPFGRPATSSGAEALKPHCASTSCRFGTSLRYQALMPT